MQTLYMKICICGGLCCPEDVAAKSVSNKQLNEISQLKCKKLLA